MALHSAGFTLATDIQVTLRDPWKLQIRRYSDLLPLPNTPLCFGMDIQKPSVCFFVFSLRQKRHNQGQIKTMQHIRNPKRTRDPISCIWHSTFWYWYRWPPKMYNGCSNNRSPLETEQPDLRRALHFCFQGLENQLGPWDYLGARKCDASNRCTATEYSVNL